MTLSMIAGMSLTTMKIDSATRDGVMRAANEDFGGVTADEAVRLLLAEHADIKRRAALRAEAEHARHNAADLAEVQAVMAQMDEISAW
jgi:hypothetical protein